jgi:DNA invertase Pin-like site-specific DNA recombinase
MHLYATLAEKERRLIAERTKAALAQQVRLEQTSATLTTLIMPAGLVEQRGPARRTNLHRV